MNIRIATIEDSGAIRAVYAPYIDTPVTFETALPTIEEFEGRVAGILPEYPYLVCEKDGRIIGYAYACRHRERAAYRWNAELSVYLDGAFVAKGLGRRLYGALIDLLRLQGDPERVRQRHPSQRAERKAPTWGWASPVSAPIPKRGIKAAAGTMSPVSKKGHPAPSPRSRAGDGFPSNPRASAGAVLDRWQP